VPTRETGAAPPKADATSATQSANNGLKLQGNEWNEIRCAGEHARGSMACAYGVVTQRQVSPRFFR